MASRHTRSPTIRQYRRPDDPQVWALAALAAAGGPNESLPLSLPPATAAPQEYPDLADITNVYLTSGGDFLVAELDGEVVGTAALLPADEGAADVVRVLVHPAARRRGVGTALMEAVEQRATGLGIRRLKLDVSENEVDAIAFYLASGFHHLDEDDESPERWDVNFFSKALRALP